MSEFEALQRVGLALAIGLLIGVERGWQQREARDGARAAGIRTYTLIGLLGGIWGLLSTTLGPSVLGFAFFAFAIPFAYFEWRQMRLEDSVSATGLISGLLTFALGAYAVRGSMAIAAGAAVASTVILAERRVLHDFLQRLKWIELRAALQLLIMTVVLLPALPDRTIDPWNALNPHQIWLMTVLIAGVSYAGYISMRLAGERQGLLYAGALGGLVTSTTVTWTFARLAKRNTAAQSEVMAAILAAWIVSLLRMTAIAVVIAPNLAANLLPPMAAAMFVLLVPGLLFYRAAANTTAHEMLLEDPFELAAVLRFGALLAMIMLLAKLVSAPFGHTGLLVLGGTSGLLDVDPITLSMAKTAGTGIDYHTATLVILTAAAANGFAKSVLALTFGGIRVGLYLTATAIAASAAGIAVIFLH